MKQKLLLNLKYQKQRLLLILIFFSSGFSLAAQCGGITPIITSSPVMSCIPGFDGTITICGLPGGNAYQPFIQRPGGAVTAPFLSVNAMGCADISGFSIGNHTVLRIEVNGGILFGGCDIILNEVIFVDGPTPPPTPVITSTDLTQCAPPNGIITFCELDPNTAYTVALFPNSYTVAVNYNFLSFTTDGSGCASVNNLFADTYVIRDIQETAGVCLNDFPDVTITLTEPPSPTPETPTGTDPTICYDGSIEICGLNPNVAYHSNVTLPDGSNSVFNFTSDASGCGEITGLGGGSHTVVDITETSTGCMASIGTDIPLTGVPEPTPGIPTGTDPTICYNGIIEICGLTPNTAYTTNVTLPDGTNFVFSFTANAGGCGEITDLEGGNHTIVDITEISTNCTTSIGTTIMLADLLPTPDTPTGIDLTTCSPGSDGIIEICGLTPNTAYTSDVTIFLVTTTYNFTTDASGCGEITGLDPGNYLVENVTETSTMCTATIGVNVALSFPPLPPTPIITFTDPTTCGGTDGTFTFCGLPNNTLYNIKFILSTGQVVDIDITTDGSGCATRAQAGGNVIFPAGDYTILDIQENSTDCINNFLDVMITLVDPTLPIPATPTSTDPTTCIPGNEGSIEICDLITGEVYSIDLISPNGTTSTITTAADANGCVVFVDLTEGAYTIVNLLQVSTDCSVAINEVVNLNPPPPPPIPIITSGDATTCGGLGSLEVCGITPNHSFTLFVAYNGTMTFGSGITTNADGCFTFPTELPGDYYFDELVDNVTGCSVSFVIEVVINEPALPMPTLVLNDPTTCSPGDDGSIEICDLIPGETYITNLIFDDGSSGPLIGVANAAGCLIIAPVYADNNYTVVDLLQVSTDCSVAINEVVNLNPPPPPPTPTITFTDPTICGGTDGTITFCGLLNNIAYNALIVLSNGVLLPLDFITDGSGCGTLVQGGGDEIFPAGDYTIVDIQESSTTCLNDFPDVMITLVDPPLPLPATPTSTDPTTCNPGDDGSIEICDLITDEVYIIDLISPSGTVFPITTAADADGCVALVGLTAGTWTLADIVQSSNSCTVAINATITLDPPPPPPTPTITYTDPTTCGGTDGTFTFCGLLNNTAYNVRVILSTGQLVDLGITTDGSGCATRAQAGGNVIFPAGDYTIERIQENSTICNNDFPDVMITLVDPPLPTPTTPTSTNPTTCFPGNDGSIEICGLNPNAVYSSLITFPNGSNNLFGFVADAAGCIEILGLFMGNYTIVDITETSTSCTVALGAVVTLDPPPPPPVPIVTYTDPTTCGGTDGTFTYCGLLPDTDYNMLILFPDGSTTTPGFITDASGCGTLTNTFWSFSAGLFVLQDIQETSTRCITLTPGIMFTLVDPPLPTPGTPLGTDPITCDGTEGEIEICGLIPNDMYTSLVTFPDGTNMNLSLTADAAGCITMTGLEDGNYEVLDVVHVLTNCLAGVNETVTLTDPPLPTPGTPMVTNPTTCDGAEGTIEICNLDPNDRYILTVSFPLGFLLTFDLTSDPSGCVTITGLVDGAYEVISIEHWLTNCLAPINEILVLTDPPLPTPSVTMVNNPTTCGGTEGSIEICGLLANDMYNTDIVYPDGTVMNINFTTDAAGCWILTDLYEGIYLIQNVTLNSTICTATINQSIELMDPEVPMPTTIVGIDPFMCGACDGRVDICGLMPNEEYEMMFTMPSGDDVALTYYTDFDGCSQNNTFFEGTHVLLSIRRMADNCAAIINQTIVLTDPPPPAPYPAVAINPSGCSAADGEIELCDLARYESYNIQLMAPDGTVTTENYPSNGDGCLWIQNLSTGTYILGVLHDNTSMCETTLNEAVTLTSAEFMTAEVFPSSVSFCPGQSATATASVTGSAGAGLSYLWSSGETSATINITTAGTYTVTISSGSGCDATAQVVATRNLTEQVQIAGATSYCVGSSTVLSAGSYASYNWSNGLTTSSISVASPGLYSVTVADANGCTTTDQKMITEIASPTPNIVGDMILCPGGTDQTTLDAGSGYASYLWSTGDTGQTLSLNAVGTYAVTVTNQLGCANSDFVVVTMNSEMQITETSNQSGCDVNDGEILISVSQGTPPYSYNWSNGSINNGLTNLSPGNYSVTVTDAANCVQSRSFAMNAVDLPIADVRVTDQLTCLVSEVMLDATASSVGPNMAYDWSTNDGNVVSGNMTLTPTVNRAGIYELTVTNTSTGCSSSGSITVIEFINTPMADFMQNIGGGLIQFTDNSIGNPTAWAWDFGDGNTSTEQNPMHEYDADGDYTVCLTITNECGTDEFCQMASIMGVTNLSYIAQKEDVQCYSEDNGSIIIFPAGGTPNYEISWTGNGFISNSYTITDLRPGSYHMVLRDAQNTTLEETFIISQPDVLTLAYSETEETNIGEADGIIDIEIEGGTGIYNYEWSNGADTEDLFDLEEGEYTCVVTDENGCQLLVGPIVVEGKVSSTLNQDFVTNFEVFPNPASDYIQVVLEMSTRQDFELSIRNIIGQRIQVNKFNTTELNTAISVDHLAGGVYYIELLFTDKRLVKKIFVE